MSVEDEDILGDKPSMSINVIGVLNTFQLCL